MARIVHTSILAGALGPKISSRMLSWRPALAMACWGREFGRPPTSVGGSGRTEGRDLNSYGFRLWMAGGGVKGGQVIGWTDELGLRAAEHPVHLNDLHASILALPGLDRTRLAYPHTGRVFRLTDVGGSTGLADKVRQG